MTTTLLSPVWTSSGIFLSASRELSNHLWQSTLFAGAMALLALTLRNYQARTRYWVWMVGSAKFLIPFSVLVAVGSHLPSTIQSHPLHTGTYRAVKEVSQPFTEILQFDLPTATTKLQPTASHDLILGLLAAFWFCGFVAVLSSWVVQWRRISAIVRVAAPLREGRELEALRKVEQKVGLSRPTDIMFLPNLMEPGIFGIIRPILLWPEALSPHLDDAHLEAVIAHEVCHVQRRDNLTSILLLLVEAVFWFYPLVWWIESRLVEERERACDEAVVHLCNQPKVYAESILKVCELCIESPLTCVSGITGADLKQRIGTIMAQPVWLKLNFHKKLLLLAGAVVVVAVPVAIGLAAQPPTASLPPKMAFDVASIKENKDGQRVAPKSNFPIGPGAMYGPNGGMFSATNYPLVVYIQFAYKIGGNMETLRKQLPDWAFTKRFDIEAKTDNHNATKDEMRLMMRSLLADRFKLTVHTAIQQTPVYALVLAKPGKLGPKLQKHPADDISCPDAPPTAPTPGSPPPPQTVPGGFPVTCGGAASVPPSIPGRVALGYRNVPMSLIANQMSQVGQLDRPVIDQTGLTGNFDFVVEFTPELPPGATPPPNFDSSGPSFTEALSEQTGLKLVAQKGPVDVLLIDHIEHPTAN